MRIVVFGSAAASYAERMVRRGASVVAVADPLASIAKDLARRLGAPRWTADPIEAIEGDEHAAVVLSGRIERAVYVARIAVQDGRRVILLELGDVRGDELPKLSEQWGRRLVLSRPLRFDRLFATAKSAIRDGSVGTPRTVRASWTISTGTGAPDADDLVGCAAELADVALWLLHDAPRTVYAQVCRVDGPPLVQVNLRTRSGSLALLESTVEDTALPAARELTVLTTHGALYHRTTHDDLLWTTDGVDVLGYADESVDQEIAAWSNESEEAGRDLAYGGAVRQNLLVLRAIGASLEIGEPVSVDEDVVK